MLSCEDIRLLLEEEALSILMEEFKNLKDLSDSNLTSFLSMLGDCIIVISESFFITLGLGGLLLSFSLIKDDTFSSISSFWSIGVNFTLESTLDKF